MLYSGPQRYPLPGGNPLTIIPLEQAGEQIATIRTAHLLILAIDGTRPISPSEAEGFSRLDQLAIPYLVTVIGGVAFPSGAQLSPAALARQVAIPEPQALTAPDTLAQAILDRLPAELHLSAARRLPGLRPIFSRELIAQTSFSNATYALASGLPEQIPVLGVPFAAADIFILTKNQALLVFRLALAHAAAPDFQARIAEIIPVIGSAFLWRQAARSLIGLIPIWGLVPKVAIAYAGTYTTGIAAWRWYEQGEMASTDQIKRISQEAIALGRQRAEELIAKAKETSGRLGGQARSTTDRLKQAVQKRIPSPRK
ncbi:MAG: hypothetical protein Fur005_12220 [Roseiflexaceae bacterium]